MSSYQYRVPLYHGWYPEVPRGVQKQQYCTFSYLHQQEIYILQLLHSKRLGLCVLRYVYFLAIQPSPKHQKAFSDSCVTADCRTGGVACFKRTRVAHSASRLQCTISQ